MKRKKKDQRPKWEFRDGARVQGGLDASTVGEELERIREGHDGKLFTKAVVMEARPESAPLHPAFTWNDKKAGENWREHEARNLIRSVQIVEVDDGKKRVVDNFVHVPTVKQPYYQSARVAVQNMDEFAAAYEELMVKVRSAERACNALKQMAEERKGEVGDKLALILIASQALHTANEALETYKTSH
jgi:hypothetical protein